MGRRPKAHTLMPDTVTPQELRALYVFMETIGMERPLARFLWIVYAQVVLGKPMKVSRDPNARIPYQSGDNE